MLEKHIGYFFRPLALARPLVKSYKCIMRFNHWLTGQLVFSQNIISIHALSSKWHVRGLGAHARAMLLGITSYDNVELHLYIGHNERLIAGNCVVLFFDSSSISRSLASTGAT